jgi:hypothetical protein
VKVRRNNGIGDWRLGDLLVHEFSNFQIRLCRLLLAVSRKGAEAPSESREGDSPAGGFGRVAVSILPLRRR